MPVISVIIPVFNVIEYIEKSIQSVINQTFQDIEIILVDDGSSDGSENICNEYADKYRMIRVVHKENGGLSSARNAGVAVAEGKYVGFVDSDDYIDARMYEVLYDCIQKDQTDVAVCGVYDVYQNGMTPQCDERLKFVCDNEEMFRHILVGEKISGTACNKLIRMSIAKQISFPNGKLFEDAFYCGQLVQKVMSVSVTTEPLYYYVHRAGSITTCTYRSKDMDVVEAFTIDGDIVKQHFPKLKKEAKFALDSAYLRVLDKMLLSEHYTKIPEYHSVLGYVRENTSDILKSEYFFKTRKIAIWALRFHVKLYRIFLILNEKKNRIQI